LQQEKVKKKIRWGKGGFDGKKVRNQTQALQVCDLELGPGMVEEVRNDHKGFSSGALKRLKERS